MNPETEFHIKDGKSRATVSDTVATSHAQLLSTSNVHSPNWDVL